MRLRHGQLRAAAAVVVVAAGGVAVGLVAAGVPAQAPASAASHIGRGARATSPTTEPAPAAPIAPSTSTTTTTARPATTTTTTTVRPAPATTSTTVRPATTTTARPATTTTAPATTTTGCAGALPARLATTAGAGQLVTVEASGYGTSWATLTAWSKAGSCWHVARGPFSARLGWAGLRPARRKAEGDGATPEGIYGFGPVVYGNAANPGVRYPYHDLVCGDWWDEDPQSADYNLFVHWPCGSTPPFAEGAAGSGSEALWRETGPYPSFAVIAYNTARRPGKGSAIFLHYGLASPTVGCVSTGLGPLDEVLDWLRPADSPAIVIGTAADIATY